MIPLLSCVTDLAFNEKTFFPFSFCWILCSEPPVCSDAFSATEKVLPVSEAVYSINVICHNIFKMQVS